MNFKFKTVDIQHEDYAHIMCTLSSAGYLIGNYSPDILSDIRIAIVFLYHSRNDYFYITDKKIIPVNSNIYKECKFKEVEIQNFIKNSGISFRKGDIVKIIKLENGIKFSDLGLNTKVKDITEEGIILEDVNVPVSPSCLSKIGKTKPLTTINDMKTDGNYRLFTLFDLQRVFYYAKIYPDDFFEMFKTMFKFDIKEHLEKEREIEFDEIEVV